MNKNQKGISIYLSLMVMTSILAIALGTSAILVSQLKIAKGLGSSVAAFYAADTAIERVIYAMQKENYMPFPGEEPCGSSLSCPPLPNGASYKIKVIQAGETNIIDVKGSYQSVNRSLRISFR